MIIRLWRLPGSPADLLRNSPEHPHRQVVDASAHSRPADAALGARIHEAVVSLESNRFAPDGARDASPSFVRFRPVVALAWDRVAEAAISLEPISVRGLIVHELAHVKRRRSLGRVGSYQSN